MRYELNIKLNDNQRINELCSFIRSYHYCQFKGKENVVFTKIIDEWCKVRITINFLKDCELTFDLSAINICNKKDIDSLLVIYKNTIQEMNAIEKNFKKGE